MSAFRVGQEVACTKDINWGCVVTRKLCDGPRKDHVYKISGVHDFGAHWGCGLRLEGMGIDWWDAKCFRPVQKRKTDISIFIAMLNTTKAREEV